MRSDFLLASAHSPAVLSEGSSLRRLPRAPQRQRPDGFADRFEGLALVYDAFWHMDGQRILLVGPPPLNLAGMVRTARYRALPAGTPLKAIPHVSLSVMVTELVGAPADTREIEMTFAGERFELAVQPNLSEQLAGRKVLFTMSQNNALGWIAEWARYHARRHGTDAVVVFDNGSTRYGVEEIVETLAGVPGLAHAAVLSWPYRYGATDTAVRTNPYYGLFLQIASMSVALRRYGGAAQGLLNADIDELVETPADTTIYEMAQAARHGLVAMRGQFIEAVPRKALGGRVPAHRDFLLRQRDPGARLSRPRKWALDPRRGWVGSLDVHPYMHWIEGRPAFGKSQPKGVFYWHFRGINTNWKEQRTDVSGLDAGTLETDTRWAAEADGFGPSA